MLTNIDKLRALKEAIADTAIGSVINVPINFLMISVAFYYEWTAFATTVLMTGVFTIIAITRKYYIRTHFQKHYNRKNVP